MKKINPTLILVLFMNFLFAQNPLVKQWDKGFGGLKDDELFSCQQTSDGGYILGGRSSSGIGGDKTQAAWDPSGQSYDYWIVKTDLLGNKLWDKTFGGTNNDWLYFLQQTTDGGYILGGTSKSGISGDKTQALWGLWDYWIIKTDSLGNKQWDKDFGGTNDDYFFSLQQTSDGGYIIGGYSGSGISGDKTQNSWGWWDYWIIKTDSLGNKQWDKDFGGTYADYFHSLHQTTDGGYILGGYSGSGISGDKTQPLWDTCTACSDRCDYWIVKTDSLGNKQWDKRFGGTAQDFLYSLTQTTDGGYILAGFSASDSSGDKTQSLWDPCPTCLFRHDYWIVKTDSLGNKQWDKDFGGTDDEDDLANISQTTDRGYLIAGNSYSGLSGDKTEGNLGYEQTWVIKTDSLGTKQWDKTLRTDCDYVWHDETAFAIQTSDGCYAMGNCTTAGIGGNKTSPNWDTLCNPHCTHDYWIIKFCDSTLTTMVTNTKQQNQLTVFPNPFTDDISFIIQKQNLQCAIFTIRNIFGQTVFNKQENNLDNTYTKNIDLGFLPNGIYLLDVIIDGDRSVKKIVKE
ncbi:MAG TPA: T9SS type A sorting domain-containing protein [Bacteroidia bacterium]|nr:T9SS type A sorting domain-containing protein [Bacteroidia bacterium]